MLTPQLEAQIRAFAQTDEAQVYVGTLLAEIDRLRAASAAEQERRAA